MKKFRLLLFSLVTFLLFSCSVFAEDTVKGTLGNPNNWYSVPLYVVATKSDKGSSKWVKTSDGKYYVRHLPIGAYSMKIDGTVYPAVCIDPGQDSPDGKQFTCKLVEENDKTKAIRYILKDLKTSDGKDTWTNVTTAVRYFAYNLSHKNNGAQGHNLIFDSSAVPRLVEANKDGNKEYDQAYTNFKKKLTGSIIKDAKKLINEANDYVESDSGSTVDTDDYGFEFTPGEPDQNGVITISVKTKKKVPEKVTFSCKSECEFKGGSMAAGSNTTTIKVKLTIPECPVNIKYIIGYKFKSNSAVKVKKVYHCTRSSSQQTFIVMTNEKTKVNENGEYEDEIKLKYSCKDTCEVDDIEGESNINMCCSDNDNQESYVIEPLIRELFCRKKVLDGSAVKLEVEGYGAGPQATADYKHKKINTYCVNYCTERIHIKIPDPAVGYNGKYFEFPGDTPESQGPYFNGYRTCRLIIKYDSWQKEYISTTESAVAAYNEYQQAQALANSYHQAFDDMTSAPYKEKTVTGTAHYSVWIPVSACDNGGFTCTTNPPTNCTFKYQYDVDTYNYVSYNYSKLGVYSINDAIDWSVGKKLQNYKGLKIDTNGGGSEKGDYKGVYLNASWTNSYCDSAATVSCSGSCTETYWGTCSSTTVENGVTKTTTYGCWKRRSHSGSGTASRTGVSRSFGKPNIGNDTLWTNYTTKQSAANTKNETYKNLSDTIISLEESLYKCDTYFEDNSPSGGLSGENNYDFSPTANFVYSRVYVDNTENKITVREDDNPFEVNCTYYDAVVATDSSGVDMYGKDLGLSEPHYNEVNTLPMDATVYNFSGGLADCNTTGGNSATYGCGTGNIHNNLSTRTNSQKYTTDAYYRAECFSNGDQNQFYTLYPYGSIETTSQDNSTSTKSKYFVEYSSLKGTFLTLWNFTNLGANSRFDEAFKEGETCSSGVDVSDLTEDAALTCTYKVDSTLVLLSGCNEDEVISEFNVVDECCNNAECIYDGEDILTYTFKIVDSNMLFPDNGIISETGASYAYNWLSESNGQVALHNIQSDAEVDKTFAPEKLTYEFMLTITDIEKIRNYNARTSFSDFKLSCQCVGTEDAELGCIGHRNMCLSEFISNWYETGSLEINGYYQSFTSYLGVSALNEARSKIRFTD